MTELKDSFCEDTPIVQASLAPPEEPAGPLPQYFEVEATNVEQYVADEDDDGDDVPIINEEDQHEKERVVGAGVASGVFGL